MADEKAEEGTEKTKRTAPKERKPKHSEEESFSGKLLRDAANTAVLVAVVVATATVVSGGMRKASNLIFGTSKSEED